MSLIDHVSIEPRFQRAVRIDTDLGDTDALRGFVCPPSSVEILKRLAHHVSDTGQAAFTWTGPYGSGKSSLVIALSALMNGKKDLREEAAEIVGRDVAEVLWEKLPPRKKGWRILGAVGRKDDPVRIIGEAIERSEYAEPCEWDEARVLKTLSALAQEKPASHGGLILFIDEMGKLLEAAARGVGDVHILQQIAELASRSNGRLVFIGILHQGFDEYATRLSRDLRDDWTKIHGRFVDLPVNVGGEEQISILSRAISGTPPSAEHLPAARAVGEVIVANRAGASEAIVDLLRSCWPLHPVTAALLGPISRRRFGQNQRSVFGFLNSAEPFGFREFLGSGEDGDLYEPARLWDYLRVNLEPAILSSPDGHRWAMAVEAIDRCAALGGDELHIALLKTISIIDLFKDQSGLVPDRRALEVSVLGARSRDVKAALTQLTKWSLIVFRKFTNAFGVYAGSDFDIEAAIEDKTADHPEVDMGLVRSLSGLQPVLCKRHYHATGALRWFDVELVKSSKVEGYLDAFSPADGTIGAFVLVVPDGGESYERLSKDMRKLARKALAWDIVLGVSQHADFVVKLALEVQALEKVRMLPDLQGDAVARREVNARLSSTQGQFEGEVQRAMSVAEWFHAEDKPRTLASRQISEMASDLADARYPETPHLPNELINRIKPSSNAVAAQNALLKLMVTRAREPRLGIEGYPAEGGLYLSMLETTGLHARDGEGYAFADPRKVENDPAGLAPLWTAAEDYLKSNADRAVPLSELYDLWGAAPFGLKRGVMPILGVAFMLSMSASVALYRETIFQPAFNDLDIDYLVKDPALIALRWMDLNENARSLLSGLADLVRDLDRTNALTNLEPIDVGRGLVAVFDRVSPWTKRTMRLSRNASAVRNIFKKANDPNRLIFNDLPSLFVGETGNADTTEVIANVREGLEELVSAYPELLHRMRANVLNELQVPNPSPKAIEDLRSRAENIRDLAGDFKLEAFVGRIANFHATDQDMEGLASLAVGRPPRVWSDADVDRAAFALAELCQAFNRAEAFAHVKGRTDKREAMAVVVRVAGSSMPVYGAFDINDTENQEVDAIVARLQSSLDGADNKLVLAALARLSSQLINDQDGERTIETRREVSA
ncbi:ATP-binding protein [Nitratireductor sp. ZSWI3]|uniref:ATP-binding protein n=1 Tax=Nitratireductor sp. ZSWI3 TaxID=2966359 RepID=UPI0021503CC9|nr:ATP-binding protein [Nitratireductor sp. ZSWI3]MCR4266772.1 ATP-binding protein [Nitratireductor sp. ZSWI3]